MVSVSVTEKSVAILDLRTGNYSIVGNGPIANSCTWSPRVENQLAVGESTHIKIYDIRKWKTPIADLTVISTTYSLNYSVSEFTPDGLYLVTLYTDPLTLWNGITYEELNSFYGLAKRRQQKAHRLMVPSCGHSNVICFVPSDNTITVINMKTGKVINSLEGHFGSVNCLAFDKYNMNLYSGGDDSNLILWSGCLRPP